MILSQLPRSLSELDERSHAKTPRFRSLRKERTPVRSLVVICALLPPVRLGPPCRRPHFERNHMPATYETLRYDCTGRTLVPEGLAFLLLKFDAYGRRPDYFQRHPPGEAITTMRSGESDRLHQAWEMPLPRVTAVPAGASKVLSPCAMRAVPCRIMTCSCLF